jgi:hypothetical protein
MAIADVQSEIYSGMDDLFTELGEAVLVNGASVTAALGDLSQLDAQDFGGLVSGPEIDCYLKKSDFATAPLFGQVVKARGNFYRIKSVIEGLGTYTLRLESTNK